MLQWKAYEDCRTYIALTMTRVYEIVAVGNGVHWARWELRVRPRAIRPGKPYPWRTIDTYKNPATAMCYANYEELESAIEENQ